MFAFGLFEFGCKLYKNDYLLEYVVYIMRFMLFNISPSASEKRDS